MSLGAISRMASTCSEGARDVLEKLSNGPPLGARGVEVGLYGCLCGDVLRRGVGAALAVLRPDASCRPEGLPYVIAQCRGKAVQGEAARQVGERDIYFFPALRSWWSPGRGMSTTSESSPLLQCCTTGKSGCPLSPRRGACSPPIVPRFELWSGLLPVLC